MSSIGFSTVQQLEDSIKDSAKTDIEEHPEIVKEYSQEDQKLEESIIEVAQHNTKQITDRYTIENYAKTLELLESSKYSPVVETARTLHRRGKTDRIEDDLARFIETAITEALKTEIRSQLEQLPKEEIASHKL